MKVKGVAHDRIYIYSCERKIKASKMEEREREREKRKRKKREKGSERETGAYTGI